MRVITVTYFALLPGSAFEHVLEQHPELTLGEVLDPAGGEPRIKVGGRTTKLAFDHGEIVRVALERLRGKLDWSAVAFALLPDEFTLRDLQQVHETILGRRLNKPSFRKRMLDSGRLRATGRRELAGRFRPAELYRALAASEELSR